MRISRTLFGVAFGSVLAAAAPALATGTTGAKGTTVHVSLWDKGPDAMGTLGTGPVKGYASGADLSDAIMGIATDKTKLPAGEDTFEVTNDSAFTVHEMIVAPVPADHAPLPYDTDMQRVKEEQAGHLGEVSELEPGQSGALRLTLKPGEYILYCNIPGHYAAGMWRLLTVTQ